MIKIEKFSIYTHFYILYSVIQLYSIGFMQKTTLHEKIIYTSYSIV